MKIRHSLLFILVLLAPFLFSGEVVATDGGTSDTADAQWRGEDDFAGAGWSLPWLGEVNIDGSSDVLFALALRAV